MEISLSLIVLVAIIGNQVEASCDKTFLQTATTSDDADASASAFIERFEAPSRSIAKPFKIYPDEKDAKHLIISNNITQNDSYYKPLHCMYKFIANEGERVVLNFTKFNLRGDEPECNHEYVDVFVKFKPEDNIENLIGLESPNGRFCTTVMPRKIVSLNNMLVLIVYSNLKPPANNKPLFSGTYGFMKTKSHDQIGSPDSSTLCTHTIYSSNKKEGEFQSVTYPGAYVKGLKCSYKFIGESRQRIRLEFLDLDLYSGGPHCPLDSIKIFDGLEETDPLINTFCGSHRSLIIYSTKENLLITFTTLQREAEIQNRGFSAYFEFSDKFVDPSFIQGQNVKHIRGSECDQRIISYKNVQSSSSGIITSPDPRHHLNAICRYIFEGLQTSLDYEKVLLKFTEFDLKTQRAPVTQSSVATTTTTSTTTTTTTTTTTQAPMSILSSQSTSQSGSDNSNNLGASNSSTEQCTDNYVRIYTGEQKADQKQDPNDYDYVFCSSEIPQSLESDAASLLMEYNSGTIGGYFKAEYTFIVDFRIPGLQASTGCDYIYKSENLRTGTFNSPRHPSWYINDINCSYIFLTKNDEALLLQFGTFKMSNSFNEKVLGYNEACKEQDLVEIFELSLDSTEQKILDQYEIGTYCGTTTPGPILSYRPVRINFKTNKEQVNYGFSAIYNFYPISVLKSNDFVTNCGGQVFSSQRFRTGTISSPETYRPETYEKRNHICHWNITARSSYKIVLKFEKFELEGSPLVRGCITASVRLNLGKSRIPIELCGTIATTTAITNNTSDQHQFVSENEWLSLTFISTKQASGSNGFTAVWTEVKRAS